MTIQTIMASDITSIFGAEANTPVSVQAVYTPEGGSAEDAVTGFFSNTPMHGDPYGNYPVEKEKIYFVGQTSDVYQWKEGGTLTINSFDYEVTEYKHDNGNLWSVVPLRRPIRNRTKI